MKYYGWEDAMTWREKKTARLEKKIMLASIISLAGALLLIVLMWCAHHIHKW